MSSYRLIATRQNLDGSWETPFIDIVLAADDAEAAAEEAANFPLDAFLEQSPRAWLTDETGAVIRTLDDEWPRAA
jgi:hypothetical protein